MEEQHILPTREVLDESFHFLQDQITRIAVEEEAEMLKEEIEAEFEE